MDVLHQPGDIIGDRYRIVALLGRGSMGATYEAEDSHHDRKRVAIKALSLRDITDWKVLELFEREAQVLANLDRPAIPNYIDYFQIDSPRDRRFYLVQELAPGKSLAELVHKGWYGGEAEVKHIALQVLEIRFFRTYYAKLLLKVLIKQIQMKKQLTQILGLSGVVVKSQKNLENALVLEIESQSKTATCPTCHKSSHRLHQNHWHLIKDLPWGETEIFLKVNRRQFKCANCQKPFSENLDFVGKRKKYTDRYAQWITEL